MAAAAAALLIANSPASGAYFHILHRMLGPLSVLHWINDALMALIFLLVGLEIKREMIDGEMSSWPRRILPGAAALAGMAVPALVFVIVNRGVPANLAGWAIPSATDIAFALGVLALLGPRVPASLKLLLTAIAVIDDLGAIVIIAIAYTDTLDPTALGAAALLCALLWGLNRARVMAIWPYLMAGAALWAAVHASGIHATLAGVATALAVPLRRTIALPEDAHSPLIRLEHALAPVVAFAIVPLFGFANAGVDLSGVTMAAATAPLPLGIALGLVLGKSLGIFGSITLLVRSGRANAPAGASTRQIAGLSMLCGIGFTMSLFITALAFGEGSVQESSAKIGIIAGSLVAALVGMAVLGCGRQP